jgi:hypothetical protein
LLGVALAGAGEEEAEVFAAVAGALAALEPRLHPENNSAEPRRPAAAARTTGKEKGGKSDTE